MSFEVSADAYARFMGRFSEPLAARFVALADPVAGQRAVDVGCGPGALTAQLVDRLGASAVTAVDPSTPFVQAVAERFPGLHVLQGRAEELELADDRFDVALAQLVVQFMGDPVAGLREMARVTRRDGVVAACVWDHGGGRGPLSTFWEAVNEIDAGATGESSLPGSWEGHLAELAAEAGLRELESGAVAVTVGFDSFEEWWQPFTLGVGPAGVHVLQLDDRGRAALRARCAALLPDPPFELTVAAWTVRGLA